MEIKKLLFVTEFEYLWFDALQSLMDLRKAGLDHVVFLHVINRDKVAMHRGVGYLKSEEVKLKEIANIRFIDWAETLFEQSIEVGAHIVVGNLIQKIITTAEEENVDLIVTGCHKKGKTKKLLDGADITEVLGRSSVPVLVHKYADDYSKNEKSPFEKPVLATDWSPASLNAINFLISLKGTVKNAVIINVIPEKEIKGSTSLEVQKIRKKSRQKLEEICDELKSHGIDAEHHLYVGDDIDQIEKAARENKASMIITGTTGKSTLKEKILGTVPKKLAEDSAFPTLFVPPE